MKFYDGFVQINNGRIRVYSKYLVDETRDWRSKFRPVFAFTYMLYLTDIHNIFKKNILNMNAATD